MVSADGLLRKGKSFLRIGESEHPVSVQLFGANPETLAEAAQIAESMGADAIDINMGCPAKQIVGPGAGVDLMRFPEKVREILTKVKRAVQGPLTVKIRSGWDEEHINAVEISQDFRGLRRRCRLPPPQDEGSGVRRAGRLGSDRESEESRPHPCHWKRRYHHTLAGQEDAGRDGLRRGDDRESGIGESVDLRSEHLGGGQAEPAPPSLDERQRMIHRHFTLVQAYYGETGAVRKFQKHVYWYTKGLRGCASFHSRLSGLKDKNGLFEAIDSYFDFVERRTPCQSFVSTENRSVIGRGEKVL